VRARFSHNQIDQRRLRQLVQHWGGCSLKWCAEMMLTVPRGQGVELLS
jgi:hypothetical protein